MCTNMLHHSLQHTQALLWTRTSSEKLVRRWSSYTWYIAIRSFVLYLISFREPFLLCILWCPGFRGWNFVQIWSATVAYCHEVEMRELLFSSEVYSQLWDSRLYILSYTFSGIYEKQSSVWFQAKSCENTLSNNVAFNMPRAAMNFNDNFGGDTTISGTWRYHCKNDILYNVLFTVLRRYCRLLRGEISVKLILWKYTLNVLLKCVEKI